MGTGYFSRFTNEITKEKDMDEMKMAKGQGKMETNKFGGKRESNIGRGRFDLIPYEGLEEVAKWFEAGAEKYGDRNWEKGMGLDVTDCANRMVRHAIKAANGYMDEGPFAHFAAVAWNALACITLIKRYPYINSLFREAYLREMNLQIEQEDFLAGGVGSGKSKTAGSDLNNTQKYNQLVKALRKNFHPMTSNICNLCQHYKKSGDQIGCLRPIKECIFEPDEQELKQY